MIRHLAFIAALLGSAGAAAQTPPAPAIVPAAPPVAASATARRDLQVRQSARAQVRLRTVAAANRTSTREPVVGGYVNATQVYPWSDGALYRLYAAPERVSDIALEPGEALVSVAAGDTARWTIGDTTSGAGPGRRTHILLKPFAAGLRTNLVITTDRRSYHLELKSTAGTAMAAVSWTYPADALIALRREAAAAEAARPVASGVPLEVLRFGYRISGDRPAWRPLRAFDDGRQTYIQFPQGLEQDDAPPLFLVGADGATELVNYRVAGHFYIVDRLFAAAELRLGGKKQQVVRITREDSARKRGTRHD